MKVPPSLPGQKLHVCSYNNFKYKWTDEKGKVYDTATVWERGGWLKVAATAYVQDEAHNMCVTIIQDMLRHMRPDILPKIYKNYKVGVTNKQDKATVWSEFEHMRDPPNCKDTCNAMCNATCFKCGRKYNLLSGIGHVRGTQVEENTMCLASLPKNRTENGL